MSARKSTFRMGGRERVPRYWSWATEERERERLKSKSACLYACMLVCLYACVPGRPKMLLSSWTPMLVCLYACMLVCLYARKTKNVVLSLTNKQANKQKSSNSIGTPQYSSHQASGWHIRNRAQPESPQNLGVATLSYAQVATTELT